MATTIVNPASSSNTNNSGIGFLIGAVLLILFGFLFFIYALPYIRGLGGNGGISVNVPKDINVNVQQSK